MRLSFLPVAAVLLALTGPAAAADSHSHSSHEAVGSALTLNNGAKWQTDAAARTGMSAIRGDVAAALAKIHDGKMSAKGYRTLAGKLDKHVEYMVHNCKLAPEVDAQLHVVLGQVMEGSELMKGKADRAQGAIKVLGALERYAQYFEHAGWQGIDH